MNKDLGDYIEMAYNNESFTYIEFVNFLKGYKEVQFWYNGIRYGAQSTTRVNGILGFALFECDVKYSPQNHPSIEAFANNANINGKLLKDIWDECYDVFELE